MKKKYTYKAIIRHDPVEHNDLVEWISGKPRTNVPIEAEITLWQEPPTGDLRPIDKDRSAKAVAALREIAKRGGTGIKDPVAWQREIRKDRPLPGRD